MLDDPCPVEILPSDVKEDALYTSQVAGGGVGVFVEGVLFSEPVWATILYIDAIGIKGFDGRRQMSDALSKQGGNGDDGERG